VRIHRLETTDAFVLFDLEAPTCVGITRLAPKVLTDSAELLARSTTYAFATFGLQLGGGSAGINTKPEGRDEAVAAYVAEVAPLVADGRWLTAPGVGLEEADLAPLREHDPRPPALWEGGRDGDLVARGAVAAAVAAIGDLNGARALVQGGPATLAATVAEHGATVLEPDERECDVVFAGGRIGSIDHEIAGGITAKAVVAAAPTPVTAKALAVFGRAGTTVIPDFVSTAAPLLYAFDADGGDAVERVAASAAEIAAEGAGAWMAAAKRAEAFLQTWQDALPFGRPLA
jgi:hypothetical protein